MVTTVRVTDELYREIKEIASTRGQTVNAVIINALWEYLRGKEVPGGETGMERSYAE